MEIIPWHYSNIYEETNCAYPTTSHIHLHKQTGMYFRLPVHISIKKKYKNNSEVRKTLNFSTNLLALISW